ncbi:hypothetical protein O181_036732 [Austropuccinia psidii MF-1]|uniref:glucan 1,3-beta-glucosidase n=1 Tax=Austropuccinia psidii MF-1 TaxID=1389203 RepID=A0A9Q3D7M4_9BASI|nr:hypothetical protein [Austropuccinia psidii MF-1]
MTEAPPKTEEQIPDQVASITPKKRPWPFIVIATILALCAIVIPIAVVIASKSDNNTGRNPSSFNNSQSIPTKLAPNALSPKPKWNFDTDKIVGVNLGNWLVLERWMNEDWFVAQAGPDAWDEWDFTLALGANASPILEEHWGTWITEADVERVFQAGINTFRVPLGFWVFIPTVAPEPYVTKGQLTHLENLCKWAYARNMYIILDLHGLPGSQNGEQQSGHNTTNPTFYQYVNQARSDQLVKAVVDWISQSAYYSIFSAIEVINEPRPYTTEQRAMIRAYYERSYATIQTLGSKAPAMLFSDGFVPGDKFAYWWEFAAAHQTNPPSLLYTDHPYPGYFPAQSNAQDILNQTCVKCAKYANFPVSTIITEWSLRTGIQDTTFEKAHYQAQLSTYSWFSGSVFWSIRTLDSKISVLADKVAQYQWSYESLLGRGSIVTPSSKNQSTTDYLKSLQAPCGPPPIINRNGSIPQGTEAAKAVAESEAAKAMIENLNKEILKAATQFGLVGIGANAYMKGGTFRSG